MPRTKKLLEKKEESQDKKKEKKFKPFFDYADRKRQKAKLEKKVDANQAEEEIKMDKVFDLSEDEDPGQIYEVLKSISKKEMKERFGSHMDQNLEKSSEAEPLSRRELGAKKYIRKFRPKNYVYDFPNTLSHLKAADNAVKVVIDEAGITTGNFVKKMTNNAKESRLAYKYMKNYQQKVRTEKILKSKRSNISLVDRFNQSCSTLNSSGSPRPAAEFQTYH